MRKKSAPHLVLDAAEFNEEKAANTQMVEAVFKYDYVYDLPPLDLLLRAKGKGLINLVVQLERPDGLRIELVKKAIRLNSEAPIRLSLDKEAASASSNFLQTYEDPAALRSISMFTVKPVETFFARAEQGLIRNPLPLKGEYRLKLTSVAVGGGAALTDPSLTVA
ncbi:MAG TPA: hypothetical protein DD789_04510, partial [Firmicutes bacterium]|nr:hypothetical protein [Bacillota bacterium]